jgi:hypothetical protein
MEATTPQQESPIYYVQCITPETLRQPHRSRGDGLHQDVPRQGTGSGVVQVTGPYPSKSPHLVTLPKGIQLQLVGLF